MQPLSANESVRIRRGIDRYRAALAAAGISLRECHNFADYAAIRHAHGDTHLNQAFDPAFTRFGPDDFWLLAQNSSGEPVATYCVRRLAVENFYDLIRSQALWFGGRSVADPRFVVDCQIPPFGGEVAHAGGLWVREDYRGATRQPRLSTVMSRLACGIALRNRPFDHDSAMIRIDPNDPPDLADRKAVALGVNAYGFARACRFVNGWFPPEGRDAVMHLCHSTRAEAVASLSPSPSTAAAAPLRRVELRQRPFVYQHEQLVDALAVRS
ncbi:MAG TPA: hypothetical protein VGR45_04835 [Stellaceae bacterium]|nr:hypothetical protein [Stellaceae bacterium]